MCEVMEKLERISCYEDMSDKQLERIKSLICGTLCGGKCKKEYIK